MKIFTNSEKVHKHRHKVSRLCWKNGKMVLTWSTQGCCKPSICKNHGICEAWQNGVFLYRPQVPSHSNTTVHTLGLKSQVSVSGFPTLGGCECVADTHALVTGDMGYQQKLTSLRARKS